MADQRVVTAPAPPAPVVSRRRHVALETAAWLGALAIVVGFFLLVRWYGIAINTVQTDSMVPTLDPTDMVVTISPERRSPGVGDIIVFETEFAGQFIPWHVHRIYAPNGDGTWTTKGDAGSEPDPWVVEPDRIGGVAVYKIPGWILRDPRILGALFFLFLCVGFWPGDIDELIPPKSVRVDLSPDEKR